MKLAILIGASATSKKSSRIPIGEGHFKFHISGLHDSKYVIAGDDELPFAQLEAKTVIKGPRSIQLVQTHAGTEVSSICIYAEKLNGDELAAIAEQSA